MRRLLDRLAKNLGALAPIERFGVLSDTFARIQAGDLPAEAFLDLTARFRAETDRNVWAVIVGALGYVNRVIDDEGRESLEAFVRDRVAPAARRCSVTTRPETRLPPRRPYESASTTLSVATSVVALPTTIRVGEVVIVRTVDMSRQVENFDAVGAWRSVEGGTHGTPIDASGVLLDGTKVDGVVSLRQALLRDPEIFVGTVVEKLMTYGLGRGVGADDMPTVRAIVRDASRQQYRFVSLVDGIVSSPAFLMRRASDE